MKSAAHLLTKLTCLLGFLGLPACSFWRLPPAELHGGDPERELAERVRARPELAVLFVGNSYSFGVPRAFSLAAAKRGKTVRTGHATYGGWSLARHAANGPTLNKIRNGRWDVIVIQEQSVIPSLSARKRGAEMNAPLRLLVSEAREHGAVPVLYQTWGRRDGDGNVRGDDFHAMTARLREGYQAAARGAGGLAVVPAGDAWEREFTAGRGGTLFLEDGSHPSEIGNALTAKTFCETFFGE